MNKVVSSVSLWIVAICLLIALIAPFTPVGQLAIKTTIVGIATLAVLGVLELIYVFARTTPSSSWKPGNSDQAEDRLHRNDLGEKD